jgi:hypothetical protein
MPVTICRVIKCVLLFHGNLFGNIGSNLERAKTAGYKA